MVAVPEGFVAVAAYEGCFRLGLFLYDHLPASAAPSSRTAGHTVLEEVGRNNRGLLVERDGKNRFLILRLIARVEQWQEAVLGDLMLVVEGFIGLLKKEKKQLLFLFKASTFHISGCKNNRISYNFEFIFLFMHACNVAFLQHE